MIKRIFIINMLFIAGMLGLAKNPSFRRLVASYKWFCFSNCRLAFECDLAYLFDCQPTYDYSGYFARLFLPDMEIRSRSLARLN